jgi:CRISPR/Cas system CMR-associated protein Cmr3 (group 5 of RAMP superfamily)
MEKIKELSNENKKIKDKNRENLTNLTDATLQTKTYIAVIGARTKTIAKTWRR